MAFPVHDISWPAVLARQPNGRLPAAILAEVEGQAGGPVIRLVAPAAKAWSALCAAALDAGHVLKSTGGADSYRPYSVQEATFRDRYTTSLLSGRPYKVWQGQRWYQRPGTAVAAVPGTSNHGWGLAIDTGEERDGRPGTDDLDQATLDWLVRNELTFGFSHELQSEPWHIRYWAGDNPPPAVRNFQEDDMANTWTQPLTQGTAGYAGQQRDTALAFAWQASNEAAAGVSKLLAAAEADEVRDKAVLAAIEALAAGGGVDPAPVIAAVNAVRDEARKRFTELLAEVAAAETRASAAEAEIQQLRAQLATAGGGA
jgi:hypothetical protein